MKYKRLILIFGIVFIGLFLFVTPTRADSKTDVSEGAATVWSPTPDTNFGNDVDLMVGGPVSALYITYIQFDIRNLPSSIQKVSIVLEIYDLSGGTMDLDFYIAADTWHESTITWNNRPSRIEYISTLNITQAAKWIIKLTDIDLTQYGNYVTFELDSDSTDIMYIRSDDTTSPPKLIIQSAIGGLPVGVIIGIVVGIGAAAAVGGFLIYRSKKKKREEKKDYKNLDWLKHQHYDLGRTIQDIANDQNVSMIVIRKWLDKLRKMEIKNLEKKYKSLNISGILLTVIGIVVLLIIFPLIPPLYSIWSYLIFHRGLFYFVLFGMGLPLICIGAVLWGYSEGLVTFSMSTEDMNKLFKRKLIFGIIYFGIGIALILWGVFIAITSTSLEGLFAGLLWVLGGPLFLTGVGLLGHSGGIKKRMKKLEKSEEEKRRAAEKREKEEKDELELEGIVQ